MPPPVLIAHGPMRALLASIVAMTRAKRCLCVIGDSETVAGGGSKFLKDWMAWLEDNADVRFVQ